MMRRLILALVILLAPAIAAAAEKNRDVLLTPGGTLYSVATVTASEHDIETSSATVLQFTATDEETTVKSFVPASLGGGWHTDPSLAWDPASETLFVFWQRRPNFLTTELLLSSYRDGVWSEPILIDEDALKMRFDLGVGISRYASEYDEEGEESKVEALAVHVIWWEQRGEGELARYAQLAIENGEIVSIKRADLDLFIGEAADEEAAEVAEGFDPEFLRHPAIFENSAHDSVEVLFANWRSRRFHRVQIRPIAQQGVLTEPIGVRIGGFDPPPSGRIRANPTALSMIALPSGNVAFYTVDDGKLTYILRRNGAWSDPKSLPADMAQTGIEGLNRLLND